ncbi:MAG: HEAT repeat domain-containing protein [Nitrospirota bacterium]
MDTRPPLQPDPDVDSQKLKAARELLLQFVKTAKTVRLYLANNPVHQKFLTDLFERFDLYLRAYGALRLKIKQQAFLVDGQMIYENESRQDNLAFRCYVDGISELAFHEGLTQRELVEFLDIMGSEQDPALADDDLVSLLWKRDFPHISAVVVDDLPDAGILPEAAQPKEEKLEELVKRETAAVELAAVAGPKRPEMPLTVYKLTDEEIGRLKEQLAKEQQRDAVAQLLDMLGVMLEIEEDPVSFGELLDIMGNLIGLFIERGDLAKAASCAEAASRLCDHSAKNAPAFQGRVREFLLRLGAPESLQALTVAFNRLKSIEVDQLTRYLQLLPPDAIAPMTELLGTLNSLQARKAVCDVLAQTARDKIELVAGRLRDDRWYIVRNLIYVMGRIGGPKAADYLAPLVRHSEPRVRKELVKTLDAMEASNTVELLLDLLRDRDGGVRVMALRALGRRKSARAVAPLTAMIEERQFREKALSEKLEVFAALAASGQAESMAVLARYLRGGSWWRRAEREQLRWCAAYALKQMGTPEALALLEEGSQGRNRSVQEACLAALRGTARDLMLKQARS